jgi:hypothetical protein
MPMRQRCVGGPHFHLVTRPLLPAARWRRVHCADDVEPILGDIDSDHGDRGIGCLAHGDLHVLGAPGQLIAGGAGARPDHLISRSDSLAASLLLRHT